MLNLTLVINCAATVSLAAAVVVINDATLVSIGLAYTSGLLTSWASRYQVGFTAETPPSTGGQDAPDVP
jgi:hypothetical protein